jgi:CBS domain-containing membrane protein
MSNKAKGKKINYSPFTISDDDIYEAMKDVPGYLDITPGDLMEVYKHAYRHALDRIATSLKAAAVMTEDVCVVKRDTPLAEVAGLMARKGISGVPVLEEDGKVAGIISEKDFLSRMGSKGKKHFMGIIAECLAGEGCVAVPIREKKAEDIMSAPAVTVYEHTPVIEIAKIFSEKNINRVPVIDEEGNLRGIVSRADIVRSSPIRILT